MEDDIYNYTKSSLKQPDRSLPDNLIDDEEGFEIEYEEERLYTQSLINKKQSTYIDFFSSQKDIKISKKKNIEKKNIIESPKNIIELPKNIKSAIRNFNPRLPLPSLIKINPDNKNFNFNNNEFPTL